MLITKKKAIILAKIAKIIISFRKNSGNILGN